MLGIVAFLIITFKKEKTKTEKFAWYISSMFMKLTFFENREFNAFL